MDWMTNMSVFVSSIRPQKQYPPGQQSCNKAVETVEGEVPLKDRARICSDLCEPSLPEYAFLLAHVLRHMSVRAIAISKEANQASSYSDVLRNYGNTGKGKGIKASVYAPAAERIRQTLRQKWTHESHPITLPVEPRVSALLAEVGKVAIQDDDSGDSDEDVDTHPGEGVSFASLQRTRQALDAPAPRGQPPRSGGSGGDMDSVMAAILGRSTSSSGGGGLPADTSSLPRRGPGRPAGTGKKRAQLEAASAPPRGRSPSSSSDVSDTGGLGFDVDDLFGASLDRIVASTGGGSAADASGGAPGPRRRGPGRPKKNITTDC